MGGVRDVRVMPSMAVCSRPARPRLVNCPPQDQLGDARDRHLGYASTALAVHPRRYSSRSTACISLRAKTRSFMFQSLSHIRAPTMSTKSVKNYTLFYTALIQVPSHQAFELGAAVFEQVHAVELPAPFVLCRLCRPSEGRDGRVNALDLADDRSGDCLVSLRIDSGTSRRRSR